MTNNILNNIIISTPESLLLMKVFNYHLEYEKKFNNWINNKKIEILDIKIFNNDMIYIYKEIKK